MAATEEDAQIAAEVAARPNREEVANVVALRQQHRLPEMIAVVVAAVEMIATAEAIAAKEVATLVGVLVVSIVLHQRVETLTGELHHRVVRDSSSSNSNQHRCSSNNRCSSSSRR